jgi:hypothetical protein
MVPGLDVNELEMVELLGGCQRSDELSIEINMRWTGNDVGLSPSRII